jgi:hypothetical protein
MNLQRRKKAVVTGGDDEISTAAKIFTHKGFLADEGSSKE